MKTIPADFPVKPLADNEPAQQRTTCGHCGRSWDDAIVTSMTPAPSARCPFEAFHEYDEPGDVDPFADSFMKPHIEHANYFEVETSHGTEIVPADVVGASLLDVDTFIDDGMPRWVEVTDALRPYLEGEPHQHVYMKRGWLARMSAPGYLDCTDWTAWDSEEDARQYLINTYGE